MKRTSTLLAAVMAFSLSGSAIALAQTVAPPITVGTDSSAAKYVPFVLAGDTQEEVEILRRLLDDGFNAVYGYKTPAPVNRVRYYPLIGPAQLTFSPDGANLSVVSAAHGAPPTEGVYLKDYGVVYTVTLPATGFDPVSASQSGTGFKAPLDPWERTRKELHGETPETEGKGLPAHQPLSDVILKILAENGRHFTGLKENERITTAVTFRGAMNCASCHETQNPLAPRLTPSGGSTGGPPQGTGPFFGSFPSVDRREIEAPGAAGSPQSGGPSAASGSAAGGSSPAEAPEDFAVWLTDVRNAVRLGELHLKRGKTQDAVAAYKEALARLEKEVFSRRSATAATGEGAAAGDVPLLLMEVDLCNKMAQVYVQTGDAESGRAMIQRASKLAKQAEQLTGGAAEANARPATSALPSKLLVTASKKLLDDVGSGKTSFEAFRKMATVEYVKPALADKK